MCGIAGIVSLVESPVRNGRQRVDQMLRLIRHRGPDHEGIFESNDGLAVIGNTRLAIVDAANDFVVPMVAASGNEVLSLNGEIYNFESERRRLELSGARFRTHSDTEVLLTGLAKDGDDFLRRADGFWGFAFYQPKTRSLLLSRDILGERNVFFMRKGSELLFASEINPILAVCETPLDIDFSSLVSSFRFRAAPPGNSLIKQIEKLKAGHNLTVQVGKGGKVRNYRYRRLHPEKWFDFFSRNPGEAEVLDRYEQVLQEACVRRVPKEVPFMATLSGGLDSALVNYFATKGGGVELNTLYGQSTDKPPGSPGELDEREASRLTARRLGSRHVEFDMMDQTAVEVYRQQCANSFDGLFCEGVIGFRMLAEQVADRNAKVLLLSDGPDELCGGYGKDRTAHLLHGVLGNVDGTPGQPPTISNTSTCEVFGGMDDDDFMNWTYLQDEPFHFRPIHGGTSRVTLDHLFEGDVVDSVAWAFGTIPNVYDEIVPSLDLGQRMALSYASSGLPDYFNLRVDRACSWHAIESRVPLQAPAFAELAIATPSKWRFSDGRQSKYLLRKLVERHIGKEIAYRSKYGFYDPAWNKPELAQKLAFQVTIEESSVFDNLPFKTGAREFLRRPEEARMRWFAYCCAMTVAKLKSRDFHVTTVPDATIRDA